MQLKGTLPQGANGQPVYSVTPEELRGWLETRKPILLLDVREAGELSGELGQLQEVVNMPVGAITNRLAELERYRDQEIITICHSGGRAHTAAQILAQAASHGFMCSPAE